MIAPPWRNCFMVAGLILSSSVLMGYLDESYSLLYDIDDHNGTISSAEIEDEGIYRCSFVIMGAKSDSFTTSLYVLGKIMCFCN